jgi:hypothetical protein
MYDKPQFVAEEMSDKLQFVAETREAKAGGTQDALTTSLTGIGAKAIVALSMAVAAQPSCRVVNNKRLF